MKAAILYEPKQPLVVADVDVQPPRQGEVLIRMAAAGVCHSDLHIINGDLGAPLPTILGHEGAGIVEAVGPGVSGVQPGDHVVLLWRASCGHCYYCARGRPALCDLGTTIRWSGKLADGTTRYSRDGQEIMHFQGVSTFAEYSVAVAEAVVPIPREVPLGVAALVGCAVMTGVGAVFNTARVEPGSSVAVVGAGGVGLNVVQGAALAGASPIVAIDLLDNKLEYARSFGATHLVNSAQQDPVAAVKELTGGRGADYAFEAVGLPRTVALAVDLVRRGGTVVAVGIPPSGSELSLGALQFITQEKTLKGSLYGTTVPHADVPRLLGLYSAGRLRLDELISRTYRLDQINEAFAALVRGEVARSIICF